MNKPLPRPLITLFGALIEADNTLSPSIRTAMDLLLIIVGQLCMMFFCVSCSARIR